MGAEVFFEKVGGSSQKQAFNEAVREASSAYGISGYTGTIAEKHEFINIRVPSGVDPYEYANKMLDEEDPRVSCKWGPAGCIDLTGTTHAIESPENSYLFFGWASS